MILDIEKRFLIAKKYGILVFIASGAITAIGCSEDQLTITLNSKKEQYQKESIKLKGLVDSKKREYARVKELQDERLERKLKEASKLAEELLRNRNSLAMEEQNLANLKGDSIESLENVSNRIKKLDQNEVKMRNEITFLKNEISRISDMSLRSEKRLQVANEKILHAKMSIESDLKSLQRVEAVYGRLPDKIKIPGGNSGVFKNVFSK